MGYRTHARHTTCPGCNEEIYMEELVKGQCPLCGSPVEELEASDESLDYDDGFERSELSWLVLQYFLFKKFEEVGANPLQVFRLLSTVEENIEIVSSGKEKEHYAYDMDAELSLVERLLLKRCSSCNKLFIRGATKKISGDLLSGGMKITYRCGKCQG
ncbi:hypothetical protein FTO68_10790 [Methanocalculus taiwanensis]|uniref:Uncharacterized protein n=1 Tax=Methanocalculus taiwanensis TaxID=106207 RepID=A0ABD4TME2_9EURY|nr:hypothetical protein [Methanocalculus taiwanensis]MCQ1539462.1 hypothetical protein [Methanocalculus taiwanensis]